jgi:uncharacterized protein (DUF1697 family)
MSRYVAFLGGINVGGHRVTMDRLRAEFEALGFTAVSTFIASGNVVYETKTRSSALESLIEARLAAALGYLVPSFVRRAPSVVEIAARAPFGPRAERDTHLVGILRAAPTPSARKATEALSNDRDTLVVVGAELHWRIHGKSMDSTLKPKVLASALQQPSTVRNVTSLAKLAAKLARD